MIDLYTWGTPNGRKVSIMLEECALPYRVHPIDISKGDQFTAEFVAINPNSKIPAIVDSDGPDGQALSLFESGAILIYLAEKTGKFLPSDARGRAETLQWLMFQMGGIGPMFGQTHHFRKFAPEPIPYAIDRYSKETHRLYGVLDTRLSQCEFVAGAYSIADMAIYPWCQRADWQGIDLNTFPHVQRWMNTISSRTAVQKGMSVPS
ncbi:glutathione S-transferase N-terminal domain-containing protein [Magnetospirillum sulfuroxidans]|uniref:Glutathione S-transferase N-terminal domain-containing protein n=1 Tax=Magnetospirillum sulfuroxidans TaxID=611300 RepID=A0ABS5I8U9_9PROT|nr:glutathione S-transferase N-terminal domain-containing protein [Magnetospirillum sulfuroxidans]MBR9970871.1 glutathione S-transferase N-terminal domain-containing protein [Magnetospirillum sulfuroxidans]